MTRICEAIRWATGGYIVEVYSVIGGNQEYVFTDWRDVVRLLEKRVDPCEHALFDKTNEKD